MKREHLIQNIFAGLTVSFVAISLGAAFGLLSGRGAFAGMLSAAVIATVTAALGGTRVQCSGPTGPMTAVTALLVAVSHDQIAKQMPGINPEHFINITLFMMAGFLVLFGILKLGKYITYIPNVVISGFMNGIAIIIWMDQIKKLFGLGGKVAFTGSLQTNIELALASLVLLFVSPMIFKRISQKWGAVIPGTFVTLIVMTALAWYLHLDVERVQLATSLHSFSDFTNLVVSQWPTTWSGAILVAALPFALQLAVLAYLDTLMTSLVVDKMTKEKTKANKELIAQGVAGGMVAALGGIPGAQATIRSVLLVKEKATLRMAGVLVGILALLEMLLFQDLINLIPQAVFSGILFKVGYDVFDWLPVRLYLKELFREPSVLLHRFFARHYDEPIFVTNTELFMIAGTTILTVGWNLNVAVGVFTVIFYCYNLWWRKAKPMRDLKPATETEIFREED